METYYFALIIGPKPNFTSIAMPTPIMMTLAELQMEKFDGPAKAPGLNISKIFYGRADCEPKELNLKTAVKAIGPDCEKYLKTHPNEVPLRIERYRLKTMARWPNKKLEADMRPVFHN